MHGYLALVIYMLPVDCHCTTILRQDDLTSVVYAWGTTELRYHDCLYMTVGKERSTPVHTVQGGAAGQDCFIEC